MRGTQDDRVPAGRSKRSAWLLQNLSSGLVIGAIDTTVCVSLAALIYSGNPEAYLGRGIGLVLLGGAVLSIVVSALTSLPGSFASPQDAPAAVLGAISIGIGTQFIASGPLTSDERFITNVVIIAGSALVAALLFSTFGLFRLGNLIRYLPYPVLAGFMAGTGALLLTGGIGIMSDVQPSLHYLRDLFAPGVAYLWLPGVALAILFLVVLSIYRHFLVWPAMLVLTTLCFYGIMWLSGGSVEGWRAQGLLLGPFPHGSLVAPLTTAELGAVRWDVIAANLPAMVTVGFIALIGMLLNAVGVERATGRRVDLNRELRTAGIGNLLAGLLGGTSGYSSVSFTTFNIRAGTGTRLASIAAASVMLVCLLFGANIVGLFPKAIVGALIAYLGFSFLLDWLYRTYFKLPFSEYLIVVAILAVIMIAGVLTGVAMGLALAVVLFVLSSSRIDAVRYAVSGRQLWSRVTRSPADRDSLTEHGDEIMVVQLQGFLFFGTAKALLERLEERVAGDTSVRFVILDFARVSGVDATGLATAADLFDLARRANFELLLSTVQPTLFERLARLIPSAEARQQLKVFDRLDAALEHAEDELLTLITPTTGASRPSGRAVSVRGPAGVELAELAPYLRPLTLKAGDTLVSKGDKADELYFLEEGRMTAWAEGEKRPARRLESLRSGGLLGELGFYLGGARSATVRADTDSKLLVLSAEALGRLQEDDPLLAASLHQQVARLMASRVIHLMRALEALER